jgi:glutamate carboxypeptidase
LLAAEFGTLPGATVEHIALRDTPAKALRIRVRPEASVRFFCSGHYETVYGADHPFQTYSQPEPDILSGQFAIQLLLRLLLAFGEAIGA